MKNTKRNAFHFMDHEWTAWPGAGRMYTADMLVAYATKVQATARKSASERKRPLVWGPKSLAKIETLVLKTITEYGRNFNVVMDTIEEHLTEAETKEVKAFLTWAFFDWEERMFGWGNFRDPVEGMGKEMKEDYALQVSISQARDYRLD